MRALPWPTIKLHGLRGAWRWRLGAAETALGGRVAASVSDPVWFLVDAGTGAEIRVEVREAFEEKP